MMLRPSRPVHETGVTFSPSHPLKASAELGRLPLDRPQLRLYRPFSTLTNFWPRSRHTSHSNPRHCQPNLSRMHYGFPKATHTRPSFPESMLDQDALTPLPVEIKIHHRERQTAAKLLSSPDFFNSLYCREYRHCSLASSAGIAWHRSTRKVRPDQTVPSHGAWKRHLKKAMLAEGKDEKNIKKSNDNREAGEREETGERPTKVECETKQPNYFCSLTELR